jgi:hypothetical protein
LLAQEPPPTPPAPSTFEPKLILPERVDEGQPIEARVVAGTLPKGAKFSVEWESDAPNRAQAGPGHKRYLWAAKGTTHLVRVNCVLVNGEEIIQAHRCKSVTVGDPLPVPTLADLAGKDAGALSAIYADLATGADRYGTFTVFNAVATAKLDAFKANPAVLEATKRFEVLKPGDPLDAKQLTDILAAVVKELGAPTPGPGPGPAPTDFTGAARSWMQKIPAGAYSKEKAIAIANAYLTVGSQGADPARNQGWTALTFDDKTKALKYDALGAEGVAAWRDPFFRPLADYQAKLIADRKIDVTNLAAVAAVWTETGEAIKAGAY